ncbi:SsgA family sporulation/cell division regulator [Streptomyces sp. NPDC127176]
MLPIAATFCYRAAAPYAVQVTFHPGLTPDVVWFLERDLLLEGTQSFAGVVGAIGSTGWVRSRACICDFSSTARTRAFSGGDR